ncbi:MAG: hypothetical protein GY867_13190 [bacterium]|nr:hypothetical protein [bacterium]
MIAHRLVSEQEIQNNAILVSKRTPKLWAQLTPDLRRQLTQHWAKLIQKMRQQSIPGKEEHNVWG